MVTTKQQEIVIGSQKSFLSMFKECWDYREVFVFLIWKEILIRYKQTVLGLAWVVVRPLLAALAFSIVFGKIAHFSSGGIPYPLLVFVALLPWQFFSDGLSYGGVAFLNNVQLVSKVYFPRLLIPAAVLSAGILDFVVFFGCYLAIALWYGFMPSIGGIVLSVAFFFLTWLLSFGCAMLAASLVVRYRDFRHIIPFFVQFGMYLSGIGFSSTLVPLKWRLLYSLNPVVGLVDGFRWALLGEKLFLPSLILSCVISLMLLVMSVAYLRAAEDTFADVI